MTILLLRHGVTSANERRLYCGSTDIPLSDRGREALRGIRYRAPENACYITSGMTRCNETLKLLFGDVEYSVLPGLREIDFGEFEMKSYEDLKDDPAYQTWLTGDNYANICPGGESGNQMLERAWTAFQTVSENAVIVTHGGIIAGLMAKLFPNEERSRYEWQPRPGCGYRLESDGGWRYQTL